MPECIKENFAKFSSCQLESAVSKMEKTEKNSQKVKK